MLRAFWLTFREGIYIITCYWVFPSFFCWIFQNRARTSKAISGQRTRWETVISEMLQGEEELAFPGPRPNTTSMGRPSGPNISFEDLEAVWSQSSMMLACMFKGSACNLHGNCDRSCSNVHYRSLPLVSQNTNLFSILMPVAAPHLLVLLPRMFPEMLILWNNRIFQSSDTPPSTALQVTSVSWKWRKVSSPQMSSSVSLSPRLWV